MLIIGCDYHPGFPQINASVDASRYPAQNENKPRLLAPNRQNSLKSTAKTTCASVSSD